MRNILKASTLESKFPFFREDGCILSKDADVTVASRSACRRSSPLPADDYEAMHDA